MGRSYNNEESDRGDKLVAFEWRVLEVVFAKDSLSGSKTFNAG